MSELKPCPFCEGEALLIGDYAHGYFVECHDCSAKTANYGSENKAEAIAAWNMRVELTCSDTNDDPCDFTCSECGASMYVEVDDCWTMIARRGWRDDVIDHPNYCPNCGAKVVTDGQ